MLKHGDLFRKNKESQIACTCTQQRDIFSQDCFPFVHVGGRVLLVMYMEILTSAVTLTENVALDKYGVKLTVCMKSSNNNIN